MKTHEESILTINGGSSSIKFAIYLLGEELVQILSGSIENIGLKNVSHNFKRADNRDQEHVFIEATDFTEAADYFIKWLELQPEFDAVKYIGHRLVHGMEHTKAEKITTELLFTLKNITAFDPEHLPGEIKLIEIFIKRYRSLVQVACFDTAFHAGMPMVAKLLSIPRKYFNKGIHRYGFHGLSYAYIMDELKSSEGTEIANGKIIIAHLGNGASLAAVKEGKCQDTSMGFTPTGGVMMGTRSGDLDPSVAWYLLQVEKLTVAQFNRLINQESGLLGVSDSSADMRELIKNKDKNRYASEAFELFCYQIKKFIGSYAAVLDGLHTLVFTGGIGEHSPEVRSRICESCNFLGIDIDPVKNINNAAIISTAASMVTVRVMKTNEQLMIAKMVKEVVYAEV